MLCKSADNILRSQGVIFNEFDFINAEKILYKKRFTFSGTPDIIKDLCPLGLPDNSQMITNLKDQNCCTEFVNFVPRTRR